jgi:hypothetical protein
MPRASLSAQLGATAAAIERAKVHGDALASSRKPATHDDVNGILGDLDESKMLAILALAPTVPEVEEASIWLGGDADVFGAAEPLKGVAGQIVIILTADENEE